MYEDIHNPFKKISFQNLLPIYEKVNQNMIKVIKKLFKSYPDVQ